jgi:hypothetical protein
VVEVVGVEVGVVGVEVGVVGMVISVWAQSWLNYFANWVVERRKHDK